MARAELTAIADGVGTVPPSQSSVRPGAWPASRRRVSGSAAARVVKLTTAPASPSDAALVVAARDGDRDAYGQLVRRHLVAAHSAAMAVLRDATDAEDVCQDAFVTALERLEDCRPEEKFRAWLLVIVRNRALDLLRRQHVRRAQSLDAPAGAWGTEPAQLPTRLPGPDESAVRADAREHLMRALDSLSDARREILLLHDLEGWTHREIAGHLGLAEGTVRAHLFWARRTMRARLSNEWRRGSDDDA